MILTVIVSLACIVSGLISHRDGFKKGHTAGRREGYFEGRDMGKEIGRDEGWLEGVQYQQAIAKRNRDKRGRWKNRTDKNQIQATI